jgi:predicted SAM-dependent methyltransferase
MSILGRVIKHLLSPDAPSPSPAGETKLASPASAANGKRVLNVGGNNKQIPIPPHYTGWHHDLLDIDPSGRPDIVCDAREMHMLPGGVYDAVYCSHNLEHYYRHHARRVLQGFRHVLKPDGFAELRVPDIRQVIAAVHERALELDDELYVSPAGPITAHDVIYGYQAEIESSGQDFYAHKTGYTPTSLTRMLEQAGFARIYVYTRALEILAIAFKLAPAEDAPVLASIRDTYARNDCKMVSGDGTKSA